MESLFLGQLLLLEHVDGFHEAEINVVEEGVLFDALLIDGTGAGSDRCRFEVETEAPADRVNLNLAFGGALL